MTNSSFPQLAKHPLIFVLVEFRFSEVAQMEKFYPDIQERLRHSFPFANEGMTQEFNIMPTGVEMRGAKQWLFSNASRSVGVVLDHKRLIVITSEYKGFKDFYEKCELALKSLIEVVKPSYLTRMGLRYSDLIVKEGDEDIKKFVHSSIYDNSYISDEVGTPIRHINEISLKTDIGTTLLVRSMYGQNSIMALEDISTLPVKIEIKDEVCERMILDFDHVWQSNRENPELFKEIDPLPFDEQTIANKLEQMHVKSRKAFWEMTTIEGREYWK